jgi:RNA polymerase sigma-70 factor (ECF subfamily)
MNTTPVTLLERLQQPANHEAWARFVRLYTPLLYSWARRAGLQEADAADLVQEVLLLLLKKLPEYRRQPGHGFRSWLRTVTLNKWRDRRKSRANASSADATIDLDEAEAPDNVADWEEAEYRRELVRRALQLMQADFQPATWKACWELVVAGRSAADVATQLGLTPGAVYAAKFRVLARLRQDLDGLL